MPSKLCHLRAKPILLILDGGNAHFLGRGNKATRPDLALNNVPGHQAALGHASSLISWTDQKRSFLMHGHGLADKALIALHCILRRAESDRKTRAIDSRIA